MMDVQFAKMMTLFSGILFVQLWIMEICGINNSLCNGTCCYGYKWNLDRTSCVPCVLGLWGENCSLICRYPSFGELCQSVCTCPISKCNPGRGCPRSECPVGFFGDYCDRLCTFPNYGPDCQKKCVCTKDVCNPATGCANLTKTTTQQIVTSVSTPEVWKTDLRSSSMSALYSDIIKVTKHIPKSVERDRKSPPFSYWTLLGVRAQAGAMLMSIIILGTLSLIIILIYMYVSLRISLNLRESRSTPRRTESFQT